MSNEILIKVHELYRKIVAVCDAELIGKCFEEGIRQLDVKKDFYEGEAKSEIEAIKFLQEFQREDATFNVVGKISISTAIRAGIINKESVMKVKGIPFALGLL